MLQRRLALIKVIRNNFKEIVFFCIVGVLATATHYFVALGSLEIGSVNLYVANLIGYFCAVTISFTGHSLLTFKVGLKMKFLGPFIAVSISTFFLSECMLWLLEEGLRLDHRLSLGVIVISIPVLSYALNKFWVYK